MIDKLIEMIRDKKGLLLLVVLVIPFILIPFVAFILKLSLILGNKLPSWMIVMRIDTNEIVSISTFIYYYTCFLAIEVTGILSYAVYQFSVNKDDRDKIEKDNEKKLHNVRKIIQINDEISENYKSYIKERGGSKWSFYTELEVNHFRKQYGYNEYGQEFVLDKWRVLRGDLNILLIGIKNVELFNNMEFIYECLDEIVCHQDKNELDLSLFKNLNQTFQDVMKESKKLINYMTY